MENETYYSLSGQKIIIIDDDENLAKSIKFFFEDHDCNVRIAYNGEEGIKLILNEEADVILVDLNMPKINGYEVITWVSKNFPATPVIAVSGIGNIKDAMQAIKQGAWDFVTKPIMNFEELEIAVLRAFEKAFLIKENNNYRENLERMVIEKTRELQVKSDQLEELVYDLKVAKEKAEASDKLKSEFLGQVSHEIRTPLNAILSFSSLIKDNLNENSSEEFDGYFEVISRAGARLIRTIELILNISDLNANTYTYKEESFDLVSIIEEIIFPLQFRHKEKGLSFNIKCEVNSTEVYLDKFSVYQAISNLIENAYKYTMQGGITIRIYENAGRLVMEISDTGIGISEEFLPKMFDPFSQEEQGLTRKYEGNGLGLTLVKRYCELNDIDLNVSSKKNAGTTFILTFNCSKDKEVNNRDNILLNN
jgi:signal transduction histidine kinase